MTIGNPRPVLATLLLVVAALAGCTSSPRSGPSSAAPTPVPSTSRAGSGSASPTSGAQTSGSSSTMTASPSSPTSSPRASPSASPPVVVGPVHCRAAQVTARLLAGGAAAGQRAATLVLQNTSGVTCTVRGYPGMQLVRAAGPVPTRLQRVDQPAPSSITLRPGQVASALLRWSAVPGNGDAPSGSCQPVATSAWVTPPDALRHTVTRWGLGPVCEQGRIQEFALVAGLPPT